MKRISKEERFDVQIMIYDTAGNIIQEPIHCDCGLTGGCEKCNPFIGQAFFRDSFRDSFIGMLTDEEADKMRKKLADFKERFNKDFEARHKKLFLNKER